MTEKKYLRIVIRLSHLCLRYLLVGCLVGWLVCDILTECCILIFKGQSETFHPFKVRPHTISIHQEQITSWCSITSQTNSVTIVYGLTTFTKSQTCLAWTNVLANILTDIKFVQKYFCTIFHNKRKFKLNPRTAVKWLTLLLHSKVQSQPWYVSFYQWLRLLCQR